MTIGADGRHHALAVVAGTAISSRTRGTANTYNVVSLTRPMGVGATVTVEIRQAKRSGWVAGRTVAFDYCDAGIVARPRP